MFSLGIAYRRMRGRMEGRHACLTPHLDYGTYEKVIQRSYQFGWWMRRKDK